MYRLALLLTMACAAAHADTELCQSLDGRTTCTRMSGNVSCTTINGETRCTRLPDGDRQAEPPPPVMPDLALPDLDIRQDSGRLRVRAGNTEVEMSP